MFWNDASFPLKSSRAMSITLHSPLSRMEKWAHLSCGCGEKRSRKQGTVGVLRTLPLALKAVTPGSACEGQRSCYVGNIEPRGTRQGLSQTGQTLVSLSHLQIRDFTEPPVRRDWELTVPLDCGLPYFLGKLRFRKVKQLVQIKLVHIHQTDNTGQHSNLEHPFGKRYPYLDSTNMCWTLAGW